jgi:hypothetical protein
MSSSGFLEKWLRKFFFPYTGHGRFCVAFGTVYSLIFAR